MNSEKKLYSFDVRDPGNFEAHLREMIVAQGTSELNTKKIPRKRKERKTDTRVIKVRRKRVTYSEKIARLRQDMEGDGFTYQMLTETTDAGPQNQKKKKRERYNEKFARLRMGTVADYVLYHRDETVQERTEVMERRREEERESRPVPSTSRAIPEFSSVDRSLFVGGPPSPAPFISESEISLLDAQLSDLLGFEAVQSEQRIETDKKKKNKKRKREEEKDNSEEKGKKRKRKDPVASVTSQASCPVLTAKQKLRLRLAEEAQVFHNISQKSADAKTVVVPVTGEQPRPGPSRSPPMITLLDVPLDDMLGFETVESEPQPCPCPGPSSSSSSLPDLFLLEDYIDYLMDIGPAN